MPRLLRGATRTPTPLAQRLPLPLLPLVIHVRSLIWLTAKSTFPSSRLTLLWRVEAWFEAVEELVEAQLPVGVLVGELNEGVYAQAPGKYKCTETLTPAL